MCMGCRMCLACAWVAACACGREHCRQQCLALRSPAIEAVYHCDMQGRPTRFNQKVHIMAGARAPSNQVWNDSLLHVPVHADKGLKQYLEGLISFWTWEHAERLLARQELCMPFVEIDGHDTGIAWCRTVTETPMAWTAAQRSDKAPMRFQTLSLLQSPPCWFLPEAIIKR